jgi:hypothetical protein
MNSKLGPQQKLTNLFSVLKRVLWGSSARPGGGEDIRLFTRIRIR